MTPQLAHDYIRRRIAELGHKDYHIRFRHFVLQPSEVRQVNASMQFYVLAEPKECIRIESDTGIFDVAEFSTNELQYEHKGTIRMTNYSAIPQQVQMIQVIFKIK